MCNEGKTRSKTVQKYRFTFVLRVVILIVDKPRCTQAFGDHRCPPRAMAIVVFMTEELHLTYRGAVAYLNEHRYKLKAMGLNKVPPKTPKLGKDT